MEKNDDREREWVFIVKRKSPEHEYLFVFRHLVDADACAARLREKFPDEKITMKRFIVREEYS